jgi:MarR family transcriptional regulator, organic hydroperoxide resistance regulator
LTEPTREDLLQQIFERLFSLMKQIHRDIGPQEPFLSPPQARLVFTIAKYNEEGLSVKDLAGIVNMTPGAITQFVDVLIEKNLVKREEDSLDRRKVRLKLAPAAINRMEQFRKEFYAHAARKFDVLSIEELEHLNRLFAKIGTPSQEKDNHFLPGQTAKW